MFPFLSIAFLISPDSKFGRLMRNPTVKFACSVVSELVFVFMLLANTILTQYGTGASREEVSKIDQFLRFQVLLYLYLKIFTNHSHNLAT